MNKFIIPLMLLAGVCFYTLSFSQPNSYNKAEKKFFSGEYANAVELYKDAYKRVNKEKKKDCLWKIAECYRKLQMEHFARIYYEKAILAKCKESEKAALYLERIMKGNFNDL